MDDEMDEELAKVNEELAAETAMVNDELAKVDEEMAESKVEDQDPGIDEETKVEEMVKVGDQMVKALGVCGEVRCHPEDDPAIVTLSVIVIRLAAAMWICNVVLSAEIKLEFRSSATLVFTF